VWGQFGKPVEGESPSSEAINKGLVSSSIRKRTGRYSFMRRTPKRWRSIRDGDSKHVWSAPTYQIDGRVGHLYLGSKMTLSEAVEGAGDISDWWGGHLYLGSKMTLSEVVEGAA
jgi:hypothetical protein